jgi:predicted esterase
MRRLLPFVLVFVASPAHAQLVRIDPAQRYELGQRLRLFERALEKHQDAKARKRALGPLDKATTAFFSGRLTDAASLLDQARHALASEKGAHARVVWAESLIVKPGTRLLDRSAKALPITVGSFYKVESKQPDKVVVRFTLGKSSADVPLKELPLKHELKLDAPEDADLTLRAQVLVDDRVVAQSEQTVSVVSKLSDRLASLEKKAEAEQKGAGPEKATLKALLATLNSLAKKDTLETNYPAARLLKEAEEVAAALEAGKGYYVPEKVGQFWLTVGKQPVRIQVPKGLKKDKPVPIVVALHGAGGSENLFFDGYGDGKAAKLCAERGWLTVSPRTSLFALSPPDVPALIDALAKTYPIDKKKVFLVGHSMGAGHATSIAGRNPERVTAVAALGGGGGFKEGEKLKAVPFFVGCGDRDFLLDSAKELHKSLLRAGVKKVKFKQYDDVEHLTVVQLALKDVFAFFDEAAK